MFKRLKELMTAFRTSLTGRRLPSVLTRLAGDERGVIVVMFAFLLPIMIGFIGLGVEVAYWFQDRRDLQASADAGALAGSYEVAEDRASSASTVAQREAEANGWSSSEGSITVNGDQINSTFPSSGNFDSDSNAVEVILTRTLTPLFIGYFMDNLTLTAGAVATVVAGAQEACVLALGGGLSSGQTAIAVNGSVDVVMNGCTLATNATGNSAVKLTGSGTLSADCVYSGGGINGTPTTTKCASPGKTNQPTVTDPYAGIAEPSFADCGSNDGTAADSPLSPDVYCKITVNAGEDLVMNAGTYFIDQGDFKVSGGGTVTATDAAGVTIVLGDSTGGDNCGKFTVTGGGAINMTAPPDSSNTYTGILVFRHSSCSSSGTSGAITFTGGSSSTMIGAIYNPSSSIDVSGGTAVTGACLQLVSNTVSFSGDGTIGNDCDGTGVETIFAGGKGSLVE